MCPPRVSFLSMICGTDPKPPPARQENPGGDLIRLPLLLEKTIEEIAERDRRSPAYELKREELHEILRRIGETPSSSPARKFLSGAPRRTLAKIYEAMNYDSPPLPSEAPHLKIVGSFRMSPEVRELLEETEMRQ